MTSARAIEFILLSLIFNACGLSLCQGEDRRCVVGVCDVYNVGPRTARDVEVRCLVPRDMGNQKILGIRHAPEPARIMTDRWGQQIAVHSLGAISAGRRVTTKMIVWAEWEDVELEIDPGRVGTRADIPEEIRELYLCNRSKYRITSPIVRKIVGEHVHAEQGLYESARALHRALSDRVHYDMDGRWDDAVRVLKRGTGSCSEFTFAMIAVCRAAGIPARFAGGTRQRPGAEGQVDLWNHRWPEVYLPGYGWVPADRDRFGRRRGRVLVLSAGDGGDDAPMGWNYTFSCQAREGSVQGLFRAYWNTSVDMASDERIVEQGGILQSASTEKWLSTAGALAATRRRLIVPFLADGLYARDGRIVSAVLGVLTGIGGRSVEVALADALGRGQNAAADERIVAALREVSGKRFASAAEWRAWLRREKGCLGVTIKALIDGRSKLVLTRSTAQWCHYSGMPPGLAEGRREPTYLEGFVWLPRWEKKTKAYGGETRSVPLRLRWPYPGDDVSPVLEPCEVYGEARLLESPKGTIEILFQNTSGRPQWFKVVLWFEEQ